MGELRTRTVQTLRDQLIFVWRIHKSIAIDKGYLPRHSSRPQRPHVLYYNSKTIIQALICHCLRPRPRRSRHQTAHLTSVATLLQTAPTSWGQSNGGCSTTEALLHSLLLRMGTVIMDWKLIGRNALDSSNCPAVMILKSCSTNHCRDFRCYCKIL